MDANADVKLVIAKLIEVAYSTDEGMTTKIVLEKEPFKMTLDEQGNATLIGKAGFVKFKGTPALEQFRNYGGTAQSGKSMTCTR